MKIIYSVIVLLLVACSSNQTAVKRDLDRLSSQPIVISKEMVTTKGGRDTLINDFFSSDIKMIVYIGAESCSSCVINKLFMWDSFTDYAEQYNGSLKYYFIFNPPKGENVRIALSSSLLDYPVLIDSLGEFERLNPHLPQNKAMHTFLLDEDNNVILVGNPLQNERIEKMFYEEVEKRLK